MVVQQNELGEIKIIHSLHNYKPLGPGSPLKPRGPCSPAQRGNMRFSFTFVILLYDGKNGLFEKQKKCWLPCKPAAPVEQTDKITKQ